MTVFIWQAKHMQKSISDSLNGDFVNLQHDEITKDSI